MHLAIGFALDVRQTEQQGRRHLLLALHLLQGVPQRRAHHQRHHGQQVDVGFAVRHLQEQTGITQELQDVVGGIDHHAARRKMFQELILAQGL